MVIRKIFIYVCKYVCECLHTRKILKKKLKLDSASKHSNLNNKYMKNEFGREPRRRTQCSRERRKKRERKEKKKEKEIGVGPEEFCVQNSISGKIIIEGDKD
ncbi:hypothetical protein ACOSQ4_008250 [Xanthoceras sorbifolium]